MVATPTVVMTGSSEAATTTFATASVSVAANQPLLLQVTTSLGNGGGVDVTSVTGLGITWQKVISQASSNANLFQSLWRAMPTSASSGTLSITIPSPVTNVGWKLIQISGADTSGTNGSGAIRQSGSLAKAVSPISVTLPQAIATGNITMGFLAYNASSSTNTITVGSGYTELLPKVDAPGPESNWTTAEWKSPGSTTVDFSTSNSGSKSLLAVEVVTATSTPIVVDAGADVADIEPYSVVNLSGTASGGNGKPLTYSWTKTVGPTISITNASSAGNASFEAPATTTGTTLTLKLTATDGTNSASDTVVYTILPWDSFIKRSGTSVPIRKWTRIGGTWV